MTAPQPTEKFKLMKAGLGLVTIVIGLFGIVYDGRFEGAGIVTAGLAITTSALS